MIDGHPVKVKDTVFVLGSGTGTITAVFDDNSFSVKTGSGTAHYMSGGYIGSKRLVYHQDPIFIVPPKNRRLWKAFVAVALPLFGALEHMHKHGTVPDAETTDQS